MGVALDENRLGMQVAWPFIYFVNAHRHEEHASILAESFLPALTEVLG